MYSRIVLAFFFVCASMPSVIAQPHALVFQTDFGLKDGAVAAMKGVAVSVSPALKIYDLTHEIPAFNIWEGAYRLDQAIAYWPAGTVFVSVIDPGVGSNRKSIVAKTGTGHFIVTPDNGTLTLISESLGIQEVREIDEAVNRLKNSSASYTFHGRDVYAYTGARLAAGVITFEQVGKRLSSDVIKLPYQKATYSNGVITGNIDILDVQYGNVWTNIGDGIFRKLQIGYGDEVQVTVLKDHQIRYTGRMVFGRTFSDVPEGTPVAYMNSLLKFSMGINMGNFAAEYKVESGPGWTLRLSK